MTWLIKQHAVRCARRPLEGHSGAAQEPKVDRAGGAFQAPGAPDALATVLETVFCCSSSQISQARRTHLVAVKDASKRIYTAICYCYFLPSRSQWLDRLDTYSQR